MNVALLARREDGVFVRIERQWETNRPVGSESEDRVGAGQQVSGDMEVDMGDGAAGDLVGRMPFNREAGHGSGNLNIVTWNIAAVNNNPFEYWVTHHDPGYNR